MILAILLVIITTFTLSAHTGWHFLLALFPAIILVGFSLWFLMGLWNISIIAIGDLKNFIAKSPAASKKIAIGILAAVLLASSYQLLFRYKYRTYKDGIGRVQVIKIDRLTGKSVFYYPEHQILKEK